MKDLQEIKNSVQQLATKKPYSLIGEPYQALASYLFQQLTQDLNIAEMAHLVAVIEQIRVDSSLLRNSLSQRKLAQLNYPHKPMTPSTLTQFTEKAQSVLGKFLTQPLERRKHNEFFETVENLHSALVKTMADMLEMANHKNFTPVYQLKYSKERIITSKGLRNLESNSKQAKSKDESTISLDVVRQLVSFNGNKLKVAQEDVPEKIEAFTGDKIATVGSKANKIFNFGGQFLSALLLEEFTFATELNGIKAFPQMNKSAINWRKSSTGKIEADVSVEIFSLRVGDNFYVLNSQGSGLEKISLASPRGEAIMINLLKEVSGSPALRAPIGTIKMTVELKGSPDDLHLRCKQAAIQYNTNQLKCIREVTPLPTSNKESVNWLPIQTLRHADLNKAADVESCINLLKSFSNKEWRVLKKYITTYHPDFRGKLTELLIKGQLNNFVDTEDLAVFEKKLSQIYPLKEYLNRSHKKLGIDRLVDRFTEFFKKLKRNSPDLSLQEPIAVLNELLQGQKKDPNMLAKISYLLAKVNEQENFHLTLQDLEKITLINKVTQAAYPPNHSVSTLIYNLYSAMLNMEKEKKLASHSVSFQVGKNLKNEQPLSPSEKKAYPRSILLNTEARVHMQKIHTARAVLATEQQKFTGENKRVLAQLDTKLGAVHAKLNGYISAGNLTPTFLQGQMAMTKNAIEQAGGAEKIPTSSFQKIISVLKNIFFSKRPSLVDSLNQIETQLPQGLELKHSSPKI